MPGLGLRHGHPSSLSWGHTYSAVKGYGGSEPGVDGRHVLGALEAPGHVGLVGHDHEHEAPGPEAGAGLGHPRHHDQLVGRAGRKGPAVAHERLVAHAVTVEEDGRAGGAGGVRTGARRHVKRPDLASPSMDRSDASSAWRVSMALAHPRARMRSVLIRTTGTSPFHPRSPPLKR